MLVDKIKNRESNIVLYGIVPPKKGTEANKIVEIANRQVERLQQLKLDGLILYDIQDEATRTDEQRPFPFLETLDSLEYSRKQLARLTLPKIIYRAVGKYSHAELTDFVTSTSPESELAVFVGASSKDQQVTMSVAEAYQLRQELKVSGLLGGVTIPERHAKKGDEHKRVFNKIEQGCSFFVSQGVYDVSAAKDFLSDYYYYGKENNIPLVPIIFTLTPCGSTKTLEFMKWLGISVPKWLENELLHSEDILQKSVEVSEQNYRELKAFADEKGIPVGCNIESVAVRKAEVEASIDLVSRISK